MEAPSLLFEYPELNTDLVKMNCGARVQDVLNDMFDGKFSFVLDYGQRKARRMAGRMGRLSSAKKNRAYCPPSIIPEDRIAVLKTRREKKRKICLSRGDRRTSNMKFVDGLNPEYKPTLESDPDQDSYLESDSDQDSYLESDSDQDSYLDDGKRGSSRASSRASSRGSSRASSRDSSPDSNPLSRFFPSFVPKRIVSPSPSSNLDSTPVPAPAPVSNPAPVQTLDSTPIKSVIQTLDTVLDSSEFPSTLEEASSKKMRLTLRDILKVMGLSQLVSRDDAFRMGTIIKRKVLNNFNSYPENRLCFRIDVRRDGIPMTVTVYNHFTLVFIGQEILKLLLKD